MGYNRQTESREPIKFTSLLNPSILPPGKRFFEYTSKNNEKCSSRLVVVLCIRHVSVSISVFFSAEQAEQWAHSYIGFYFATHLILAPEVLRSRLFVDPDPELELELAKS